MNLDPCRDMLKKGHATHTLRRLFPFLRMKWPSIALYCRILECDSVTGMPETLLLNHAVCRECVGLRSQLAVACSERDAVKGMLESAHAAGNMILHDHSADGAEASLDAGV